MENFKTYRHPKWDDTFLVETVMGNEGWQSLTEYLCLTRYISTDTLKAMRITLPWRRFGKTHAPATHAPPSNRGPSKVQVYPK